MGQLFVKRALLFVIILSKCISNCEKISEICSNPTLAVAVTVRDLHKDSIATNTSGFIFNQKNVTYFVNSEGINKLNESNLELVWSAKTNNQIQMIHSISFGSIDFLIIGYEVGYCNVLVSENSNWRIQQSIKNFGMATAASFFISKSNLYLLIINQKDTEMAPSILYKWKRTYFDEIDRLLTIAGNNIVTFNHNSNVLVVITQNASKIPKIGSLVLSMQNDKLINSQHLPTNAPLGVYTFTNNASERFVLINNKIPPHQIYKIRSSKKFLPSKAIYDDILLLGFFVFENLEFSIAKSKENLTLYQGSELQKVAIIEQNMSDVTSINIQATDSIVVTFSSRDQIRVISFQLEIQKIEKCKMNPLLQQLNQLEKLQSQNHILLKKLINQNLFKKIKKREISENSKIFGTLEEIKSTLIKLEEKNLITTSTSEIFGKIIVKKDLKIGVLKSSNLIVTTINDQVWNPNEWLSQGSAQNITGHFRTEKLIVNNLIVNPLKNDFVNDILLTKSEERQILRRPINIQNLLAFNIHLDSINQIPFNKMVTTKTEKLITGSKKFKSLKVGNLTVLNWNKLNIQDTPEKRSVDIIFLSADLDVENLQVQNINGINFDKMVTSLFLKDMHSEIEGNLNFIKSFHSDKVNATKISNLKVANILTRTTDQNITTPIRLKSLKAINLKSKTLNDINFNENVARSDQQNRILSPVSMLSFETLGNLTLKGDIDNATWLNIHNHIVGTQESDLLQIYNEPVIIHGTIFVKNIIILNQTKVVLGGDDWRNEMIQQKYWLKNVNQRFDSNITFKSNLTVPNIKVETINQNYFGQFVNMNTSSNGWPILPTKLIFENVKVEGNVTTFSQGFPRMLDVKSLANNAIRYNGTYKITGPKIVTNLTIRNLNTENINDKPIRSSHKLKLNNIIIKGDVQISNRTRIHVKNLTNSKSLTELNKTKIQGKNLNFKTINGHQWEKIQSLTQNNLTLNRCVINGNVTFDSLQLQRINNFSIQKNPNEFRGVKNFTASLLQIKNLITPSINNISFEFIKNQTLSRTRPQTITGNFTFQNITTRFMEAKKIDGLEIENLLTKSNPDKQTLNVEKLKLRSADVKGSIISKTIYGEDFNTLTDTYNMLGGRRFSRLTVLGNISVPETKSLLGVFENSIYSNRNNNIAGTVYFTHRVLVKNLRTRKYIHDINLKKIQNDALFSNVANQVVKGNVFFKYDLFSQYVNVHGSCFIPIVNEIDIELLDRNLIRANTTSYELIGGKKYFLKPIIAKKLKIPNRIHGVLPEMIVSTSKDQIIPAAYFTNLTILNNLHMFFVNDLNFTKFLTSRLLKSSDYPQKVYGSFQFENIFINSGNLSRLNDVEVDNIITDSGVQNVETALIFMEPVEVNGALNIEHLNNVNIKEAFKAAIFVDEDVNFNGNIIFMKPTTINGPIKTELLNNFKIDDLYQRLEFPLEIPTLVRKVHTKIFNGLKLTENMASKYMYLEYLNDIPISEFNVNSIQNIAIDDSILFHLRGNLPGDRCNLDISCDCPVQYSFQLRPNGEVDVIHDLKFERTFTFKNNNGVIINIFTNTLSSSNECSNSLMNESSQIVWFNSINLKSRSENRDNLFLFDPKKIPKYLSDVVYFEDDNDSYLVMAFYYDSASKSHRLNSLVLRLSSINNTVELVQEIQTFGVQSLNMVETAQGSVLILGNTMDSGLKTIETPIYRFDRTTKKFMLLRSVINQNGFGSISSGVLSNGGSLIVLAERNTQSLLIFSYNNDFDNYYFYQALYFEFEVASTSIFYNPNKGDMFLSVITRDGQFHLFGYKYLEGFILETKTEIENSRIVLPFEQSNKIYLMAATNLTQARIYKPIILGT